MILFVYFSHELTGMLTGGLAFLVANVARVRTSTYLFEGHRSTHNTFQMENEIIYYELFCGWLLSLNAVFVRFLHIVTCS